MMLNLSGTHPKLLELLKNNSFSVSKSTVPRSRDLDHQLPCQMTW